MSVHSGKYENERMGFEKTYIPDDPALDASIKAFMRAESDLQDIMSDPFLESTRTEVGTLTALQGSMKEKDSYQEKQNYIQSALCKTDNKSKTKVTNIEISKSDINEISAEWVREWHKKKQMQVSSPADQERKNFITASIKTEEIIPSGNAEPKEPIVIQKRKTRSLHIISLAAAAVLGAIITIKALVPSGNPAKIFESFYQPYDAVNLVTRGVNNETEITFNQAVFNYKSGKYEEAAIGFAESAAIDPSLGTPSYYIGLASMETGDYDKAIEHFSNVISMSGNFVKESKWYLGLTYLKTGDKEKAAECFRELAGTEGYFSKPADKILRRLK